jgi:hypothetical protein
MRLELQIRWKTFNGLSNRMADEQRWNMKQSEQVLEWMAEGAIEGQVNMLLRVLASRFPPGAPTDLANLIRTTATAEKLERWGEVVGTATSLDDFRSIVERNGA